MCSKPAWPETSILFLALSNIHFLRVLRKSLRNNAPLVFSTLVFSPVSPPTLAHYPPYSRWHTTHVNHTGTSPALTLHPCKRTTRATQVNHTTTPHMSLMQPRHNSHMIQLINHLHHIIIINKLHHN